MKAKIEFSPHTILKMLAVVRKRDITHHTRGFAKRIPTKSPPICACIQIVSKQAFISWFNNTMHPYNLKLDYDPPKINLTTKYKILRGLSYTCITIGIINTLPYVYFMVKVWVTILSDIPSTDLVPVATTMWGAGGLYWLFTREIMEDINSINDTHGWKLSHGQTTYYVNNLRRCVYKGIIKLPYVLLHVPVTPLLIKLLYETPPLGTLCLSAIVFSWLKYLSCGKKH